MKKKGVLGNKKGQLKKGAKPNMSTGTKASSNQGAATFMLNNQNKF
tara:strand:- start:191 stop:328 length:138 start_codon:yes stop_codon:yes gene_type:complete